MEFLSGYTGSSIRLGMPSGPLVLSRISRYLGGPDGRPRCIPSASVTM